MMFYICITIIGVAAIAGLVVLGGFAIKYKMYEISMETTKDLMGPVNKLCDVMVLYFKSELDMNDDYDNDEE